MKVNSDNFNSNRKPKNFHNPERFVEGWYWVIPSQDLRVGEVKPVTIMGRELVVYRGEDKRAVIFDAYCPHMGAHFAEGRVEGNELRCFFHHWKFDQEGICVDVPCAEEPPALKTKTWPSAEQYGLIWVWTGESPQQPLPFIPEWENRDYEVSIGNKFVSNCHPHGLLINAIDTQHWNTVRKLPLKILFEKQELNYNAIIFQNITQIWEISSWGRLIQRFYKSPIIYSICYWFGANSIVSLGTNFIHFHLMFVTRMLSEGRTEGRILFMVRKHNGILGWIGNKVLLCLLKKVSYYFVSHSQTMLPKVSFEVKTPIQADQSIVQFINHLERQKPIKWQSWNLARSLETEMRDNREKRRDESVND
ncbi:Rieske (2Fe-2S) domain protein [Richelia sinica FACHB-800]|uniref:Rieske (2Fe-2S) domain protein n=1 Tax=Richelia sinica FACHB-800 TaxID=1357546 RepID=A0A975T869_9NOST|nr:aromatic ring-hydroxylating dioxygenase subunit alpha [Richelia sinica]MBD2666264.1 aromatic ring-hydroxylating dioxygenase subunit alpha [Richelia sinica FACHB-800]QXE23875.1 Rieske (2Fe-2S) domain protein [Richelia sinica FACHB-800]